MKARHFVSINDLSAGELREVLSLAYIFKAHRRHPSFRSLLHGKFVALMFEKQSIRARRWLPFSPWANGGGSFGTTGSYRYPERRPVS